MTSTQYAQLRAWLQKKTAHVEAALKFNLALVQHVSMGKPGTSLATLVTTLSHAVSFW